MAKELQLPANQNYGLSAAEKKRDWLGGSFLRWCITCKKNYFDHQRDGRECQICAEK